MLETAFNLLHTSYRRIHFVDDLDLDAAVPRVGANLHCVHRLLQRHRVRDELLQVEDLATQALNACGPRVAIPIYEAEVDLQGVPRSVK